MLLTSPEFAGNDVLRTDCSRARVVRPPVEPVAAVARFGKVGCHLNQWAGSIAQMYKWCFFSLVQYSFIIYADLDVELLRPEQPPSSVAERWRSTAHLPTYPTTREHAGNVRRRFRIPLQRWTVELGADNSRAIPAGRHLDAECDVGRLLRL